MKLSVVKGATSVLVRIFIQDSSSLVGAGLTGLVFNTSGLTCCRMRDDDGNAGATSITLATATLGTWASGGFKEKDATNAPGWYEFGIPNAALTTGSRSVGIHFKGATNMAPCPIEIELTGWDNQDGVHGGLTALPNTAVTTNGSLLTSGTGTDQLSVASGLVNVGKINGVSTSSVTIVSAVVGTTQAITFNANNFAKVSLNDILATTLTETSGQLAGGFKKFFNVGAPASTMEAITQVATVSAVTGLTASNLDTTVSSRGTSTLTQTQVTGGAYNIQSASCVLGDARIANLDAAVSTRGTSTLTQAQVTGGAYTIQSVSCVLGDARVANLDVAISTRGTSTLTQTQVTGGAYSVQSASCVLGDARAAHLDADISSRMATFSYTVPPTVIAIRQEIDSNSVGLAAIFARTDVATSTRMATYTQPAGFLAATFPPGTVANTINITAGTMTTTTNLTNAPTAGDFTSTMKTGLNAATPASVQNIVAQTADVGTRIPANLVMTAGKVWALDGSGNAIAPASDTTLIVAQGVKILAADYDSVGRSGNVLTLSNGATQTISGTGRVTA